MNQGKRLNNDSLLEILCTSETPTAVYSGEEIRIELANAAMLKAWGKGPEVIGGTLPAIFKNASEGLENRH
jgi:hypothetical protein